MKLDSTIAKIKNSNKNKYHYKEEDKTLHRGKMFILFVC